MSGNRFELFHEIMGGGQMVPELLISSGGICQPAGIYTRPVKLTFEQKLSAARSSDLDTPEGFYFGERFSESCGCGDYW